jgi:hypothetical protein
VCSCTRLADEAGIPRAPFLKLLLEYWKDAKEIPSVSPRLCGGGQGLVGGLKAPPSCAHYS